MAAAQPVNLQPGQVWDVYHDGSQGLGCGHRLFVLATMNAERVTLLETYELARVDMGRDAFASYRRKALEAIAPRRIAKRIRAAMKEGRLNPDLEVADLALSALGWTEDQPTKMERTMLDISIPGRLSGDWSTAIRAATRLLGAASATEGQDFEIKPAEGGKVAIMLKTGEKAKTDKIAPGPSGMARQMAAVEAGKKAAKMKAAGAGIAAAIAERHGADVFSGKKLATKAKPAKAEPKPKKAPAARVKKVRAGEIKRLGDGVKAAKAPKPKAAKGDGKNKVSIIAALLQAPEGTTTKAILAATGWPSVSVPQQAKAAGLKLRKEKVKGEPTRYYGTAA